MKCSLKLTKTPEVSHFASRLNGKTNSTLPNRRRTYPSWRNRRPLFPWKRESGNWLMTCWGAVVRSRNVIAGFGVCHATTSFVTSCHHTPPHPFPRQGTTCGHCLAVALCLQLSLCFAFMPEVAKCRRKRSLLSNESLYIYMVNCKLQALLALTCELVVYV